jgi:hypothetical protein
MPAMTANVVKGILLLLSVPNVCKGHGIVHNIPPFVPDDEKWPSKHIQRHIITWFLKACDEGCDMPALTEHSSGPVCEARPSEATFEKIARLSS